MRKWMWTAATVVGVGLLSMPASADLPPSLNPLRHSVYLYSETGGIFYSLAPELNTETGTGSLTLSEADLGSPPAAGVEFDLQVDVDADATRMIMYTLTLVNGTAGEIPFEMTLTTPMAPYDQTLDARHSLTVTATDANGGGVTVTPNKFIFGTDERTLQQAFANGVDFVNPPFAQAFGDDLGNGDLFSSDSPLGAGETSQTSGPRSVPTPEVFDLTPDGKFNNAIVNVSFKLSAGDRVTLVGKLEIAKDLGGGGGGGGGEDGFQPVTGTLGGKQLIKAKKIAKITNKDFSQGVTFNESTFSFQDGDTRVDGLAEVKKNGKSIKLTLDAAGKAQLTQLIASLMTDAAGQPVTVELTKEPKGKGSADKDGEKSKFAFAAKGKATMGEVVKGFTYKVTLKGALSIID